MNINNSTIERRTSILKNRNNSSEKKQGVGTTVPQSVTFKQTQPIEDVRQFNADSPPARNIFLNRQRTQPLYSQLMATKDIKFIHTLYQQVIGMISICSKKSSQESIQCRNIANNILKLIQNNLSIKEQLCQQYKKIDNLHQLASYIQVTPEQLLSDSFLKNFIEHYKEKQCQLIWLENKCKNMFDQQFHKKRKILSSKEKKSKEKKKQYLKNQIQKEKIRIHTLQKQENNMLRQLYQAQKTNNKQQKATSSLKMLITQLECKKSYQKLKRQKKQLLQLQIQKQNKPPAKQSIRHQKIQSVETVVSKKSLGKLFRK